jgi:hypothetical protein
MIHRPRSTSTSSRIDRVIASVHATWQYCQRYAMHGLGKIGREIPRVVMDYLRARHRIFDLYPLRAVPATR